MTTTQRAATSADGASLSVVPVARVRSDTPAGDVDDLVQTHLGLAGAVWSRYRDHGVDPGPLGAAARDGLAAAAETFDPEDGVDFVTHALPYVRVAVKRVFRAAGGRIDQAWPRAQASVIRHDPHPGTTDPFG